MMESPRSTTPTTGAASSHRRWWRSTLMVALVVSLVVAASPVAQAKQEDDRLRPSQGFQRPTKASDNSPLRSANLSKEPARSTSPEDSVTVNGNTLVVTGAFAGTTDASCDPVVPYIGSVVGWCVELGISPGFGRDAQGNFVYLPGVIRQDVWDRCGNLVFSNTDSAAFAYPSAGYYGWWIPEAIPWDTSVACAGTWTSTAYVTQTFPDGTEITASVNDSFEVYPDAPSAAQAVAQSYGGSTIHSHMADPVDTFTGAFNYAEKPDAMVASKGMPLVVSRSYASNDPTVGPFGRGWSFPYNAYLEADTGTGNVTYHASSGSQQLFTRKTDGSFTAPAGVQNTLTRNTDGTFSYLTKDVMRYDFTSAGKLTAIRDRNGQGPTLTYDTNGRLNKVIGSGSRELTFVWDDALNRISSVSFPGSRTVSYNYSANGRLLSFTDAKLQVTRYRYDSGGRLESVQEANDDYEVRLDYDDTSGRVISQQDGRGNVTTFAWNESTQTATTTDPAGGDSKDVYLNGYLIEQIDALGSSTRYSWDDRGLLRRVSDPTGSTTVFHYDGNGNLSIREAPVSVDGLTSGPAKEYYFYNSRNDLTQTRDFKRRVVQYEYDANGNLSRVVRPDVNTGSSSTALSYTYNADGTIATSTDAMGKQSLFGYNAAGDTTSVTDPMGQKTSYTYDSSGRLKSTVDPRGNVTGANPDQYRTTLTYDELDRVVTTTDPLGIQVSQSFDSAGRVSTATNGRGKVTSFGYDADDHVTSVQGPDASIPAIAYTYDTRGNRRTMVDARGNTTTYNYDAANRLKTVAPAGAGTWTYDYNKAGAVSKVTAPSGRATTMVRNARGQVTQVSYSDGTPSVSFQYDANGNRTRTTRGTEVTTYAYNILNQITSVTRGTDTFSYGYDNLGRMVSRTYPGQAAESLVYDDASRLTAVKRGTTNLATYGYDTPTGTATTQLPNGVVVTKRLDAAGRPSLIEVVKGTKVIMRAQYTLDGNGNPTSVVDETGATNTYQYDVSDRLTKVCFKTTNCATATDYISWAYDGNSNRTTETRPGGTTTWTYNAANRMTQRTGLAGASSYTYDADGNLLTGAGRTYTWNAAGHMLTSAAGSKKTTFAYDADGRRVSSTLGTAVTKFLWDPTSGDLALERDGSNKLLRQYTYGTGLISETIGTSTFYYHKDGVGSVRALTDSAGAAVRTYTYEPYGVLKSSTAATKAPVNQMQFAGAYNDGPHYHLKSRNYSPVDGVFFSSDPVTDPGVSYGYAAGNPMANIDPLGMSDQDWTDADTLNEINGAATTVGAVAGTAAIVCSVVVACAPIVPIAAPLALAASAVAVMSSSNTVSCISGKGGCTAAVVGGALIMAGGRYGLATKSTITMDVAVIGSLDDTAAYIGKAGYNVLNDPLWYPARNDAWIREIIRTKQPVLIASPRTRATVWDDVNDRFRVFGRELQMLENAGYRYQGSYLLPPM